MDGLARQLAGRALVNATEGRCVCEVAIDLALLVLACEALEMAADLGPGVRLTPQGPMYSAAFLSDN